jgi:hypothetical protein
VSLPELFTAAGYRHFFNHCLPFIDTLRKASALFPADLQIEPDETAKL